MHRQPEHVQSFFLAEMGTDGSIDGNIRLVIKGRFQPKQVESLLKKYIVEYVTCHSQSTSKHACTPDRAQRRPFLLAADLPLFVCLFPLPLSLSPSRRSVCRNPETTLTRDSVTRLYFIQCESCGSRRSVAPIKTGFHATNRVDRRKVKAEAI